jgi:hypothetical protein
LDRASFFAALRAQGKLRLTTQKTHKVLIIPMPPPLARHVESLPGKTQRLGDGTLYSVSGDAGSQTGGN